MNIREIRQQYPQYNDLSDGELARLLRQKFYPDIAPADFNARIGLDTSGFIPAVKAGYERMKGEAGLLAGKAGIMSLQEAERYKKEREAEAAVLHTPTEKGWAEAPWLKFRETLGGSVPYMAAPLAAGAAATGLGAPGLVAAGLGALASGAQFTGSNLARQMETGKSLEQADLGKAALAAIPQAALDTVSMRMIPGVGRLMGAAGVKVTAETAEQIAKQSLAKVAADYALTTGKTMTSEGLTEAAQQVFERMQAGLNLTDPEARKEYLENFIGGAVLGGAIAPAGRYMERSKIAAGVQPTPTVAEQPPEQPAVAEGHPAAPQAPAQAMEELQTLQRDLMGEALTAPTEPPTAPASEAPAEPTPEATFPPLEAAVQEPTLRPKNAPKEELEPVHPAVTPELGPTTYNWANKAGRKWVESIAALSPEEAAAQRKKLVGRSQQKADIFDAIHAQPTPSTAYVEPDIRLEPEGQRPTAEPGVEPPAGPTGQPGFGDQYPERVETLDGAGVAPDRGVAGEQPGVDVQQPSALETQPTAEPVTYGTETTETQQAEAQGPQAPTEPALGIDQEELARRVEAAQVDAAMMEERAQAGRRVEPEAIAEPVQVTPEPTVPKPVLPQNALAERRLARLEENLTNEDYVALRKLLDTGDTANATKRMAEIEADMRAMLYNKSSGEFKDPSTEEATTVETALKDASPVAAARWLADNSPNPVLKEVAAAVAAALHRLQLAGVQLHPIKVAQVGESVPRALLGSRGISHYKYDPKATDKGIQIWLNGSTVTGKVGVSYEVALHELVHAATQGAIRLGNLRIAQGKPVADTVRRLYAVNNAIIGEFNKRVKEFKGGQRELTTLEQSMFEGRSNAFQNPDEVIAWALTNPDAQSWLNTVDYAPTGKSLWQSLVDAIGAFLGLSPRANSALQEVLSLSKELLDTDVSTLNEIANVTGTALSVQAPVGEQYAVKAEQAPQPQGPQWTPGVAEYAKHMEHKPASWFADTKEQIAKNAEKSAGLSWVTKLRTRIVDNLAAVEARLDSKLTKGIRDEMDRTSEVLIARQAADVNKLLQAFYEMGGLVIDSASKMLKVTETSNRPDDALKQVHKLAERTGVTFEEANARASWALVGKRLGELVRMNENGEADTLIHWRLPNGEIDMAQIQAAEAEFEKHPEIKEAYRILDETRKSLVKLMVSTGRLTKEQGKMWEEVINYVPFDRVDDLDNAFRSNKNITTGLAAMGKLPQIKGSQVREVNNVFENYYKTLGWMVGQVAKQNANTRLMFAMVQAGYAEKVHTVPGVSPTAFAPDGRPVVSVYLNGEQAYFSMASEYDAIAFLNPNGPPPKWVQFFGDVANVLRHTITANPVFAARQVFMDVQGAMVFSKVHNPFTFALNSFRNFGNLSMHEVFNVYRALRGEAMVTHDIEKKMRQMGLSGEVDYSTTNPATEELIRLGLRKRTLLGSTTLGTIVHGLNQITHASDLAVRKALFDDETNASKDTLLAAHKARELINFRRRGSSQTMQQLITMVPFLNATAQSMDIMLRTATGKNTPTGLTVKAARKRLAMVSATYGTLALLYAASRSGDDDYEKMDRRQRDLHWTFDGMKIPVRGDMGILKVAIENGVDYYRRSATPEELDAMEAIKTVMQFAWSSTIGGTVPVPAALKPVFEIMTNYSTMTGRELVGTYQKGKPAYLQETSATSEMAKAMAESLMTMTDGKVNVSPIHIDTVLRGYLGTAAATTASIVDAALNPDKVDRPLHKSFVLGAFMYDEATMTNPQSEFYELQNKVSPAVRAFEELKQSNPEKAEEFFLAHEKEIMLGGVISATLEQLSDIRKAEKYLNGEDAAKSISKEERKAQLDELRTYRNGVTEYIRELKANVKL